MSMSRRSLLGSALATSVAFSGLGQRASADPRVEPASDPGYLNQVEAYGPLVEDPKGILNLPKGFSYQTFSHAGETMDDGFKVPFAHDGMAAFPHASDPDKVVLVRNHELKHTVRKNGPLGEGNALLSKLDASKVYDFSPEGYPLPGGTTTLIYNIKTRRLESHFLSLTGTSTNCAGGATPWGSWLTCEETTQKAGNGVARDHGYVFEVPSGSLGLAEAVPLKAMGRFKHEAVAIDPRTGIVYLTEDTSDGAFYRFLPHDKRYLGKGGKLQALMIREARQADTSNGTQRIWSQGDSFTTAWVDLADPESPDDSLRLETWQQGGARFARGEGIHYGASPTGGEIYFTCTSGGPKQYGQIMRYTPSPFEGTADEAKSPGRLNLFIESSDLRVMDYADNLTVSPWGHLFVCEDRYSDVLVNHMRIVTMDGKVATFAANVSDGNGEWAGASFSPDGSTLFANLQSNGLTVAITGPWADFKA